MKVFWMFSGGASSLKATFDDPNNTSNGGKLYYNIGAYHDKKDAKGVQLCKAHDIPEFFLSRRDFYRQHELSHDDPDSARRYYGMLTERIDREFSPDIICLSGFMRIVYDPLLGYMPILNVHPADLAILAGPNGERLDTTGLSNEGVRDYIRMGYRRKLRGDNAVFDAIMEGETFTCSTVHILTEEIDGGPILAQSKRFSIGDGIPGMVADPEGEQFIRKYAKALQERMKEEGDGPAYLAALEMISRGHLATEGDIIFLDGNELPYCGVRLK